MNNHSSTSLFSSRVLLASIMLVIVLISAAAVIRVGHKDAKKVPADKPEFGVVRGVVYSPPNSCAVVDEEMVHEGDEICDISVVAIQSDSVEFSKAGLTWRQEVLEIPNETWTASAEVGSCDGK